jgi:hypothetical protein
VKALLDNRKRYERETAESGEEAVFQKDARAKGYLRGRAGYRLFDRREELCEKLTADVKANGEWLLESVEYPLARL